MLSLFLSYRMCTQLMKSGSLKYKQLGPVPFVLHLSQKCAHLSVSRQQSKQNGFISISFINSISNNEALPQQCKKSVIVCIHDKDDKTDCSNYWGVSLLSTAHTTLSNILHPRVTPYIEKLLDAINLDFSIIHQLLSVILDSSST